MVAVATLKYLTKQRLRDAEVLFYNSRYSATVYLTGYALELGLKRKICQTLSFTSGFPESTTDFNIYTTEIANFNAIRTGDFLNQLRQIKNHDLNNLLTFSGARPTIMTSYQSDWFNVKDWDPASRYKREYITSRKAESFIISAKQILKQIV